MDIQENIPLSYYTTIGLGGEARYFVSVKSLEELQHALIFAKEKKISFFLLGRGSNTLFDDRGYNGLVILNRMNQCKIIDNQIQVDAGYSFANLGMKTAKKGFSGLEFASGIPGSVGGAVFMNAGANGKSTWDVLETITFIDEDRKLRKEEKTKFQSSYRFSSFQKTKSVIVSATFRLIKSSAAKDTYKKLLELRINSQPYGDKSAGCIFKNPTNEHAGALIDSCKLKGLSVGKAKVSDVHANFIVTEKGVSSQDIHKLITLIKHEVFDKKKIMLEQEVRIVPYQS